MEVKAMPPEVIVGLLSLAGTLIGTIAGILASNNMAMYRIQQLEKKVDQHNQIVIRTFKLEESQAVTDEQIKTIFKKLDSIKKDV